MPRSYESIRAELDDIVERYRAHIVHEGSKGGLTREEIESVHFEYGDLKEYEKKYDPAKLKDGWNVVDGEEIFYISNPGLGLWAYKGRFVN